MATLLHPLLRHRPLLNALVLALTVAATAPALGQSGNAPSREREALRRAQAALQQAQQQRDALQAEKAALERSQADQAALAARLQAEAGATRAALQRLRDEAARVPTLEARLATEQQALASVRAQADAAASTALAGQADLRQQLATLQRQHAERLAVNQALVARLAAATTALAEAQARNARMHAAALQAIHRLRDLSPRERALQADPLLGTASVRLHADAEALLLQLDAQRQPSAPAQ